MSGQGQQVKHPSNRMSPEEQRQRILASRAVVLALGKAALDAPQAAAFPEHLERMQLANPEGMKEDLYQRLLLTGLKATTPI